jgi:hypothetical protein
MRLIAGPLNKQLLQNLLSEVIEPCTRVRAAVAYANRDNLQLFEACAKHLKPLEFFGRYDHTVAVAHERSEITCSRISPGCLRISE